MISKIREIYRFRELLLVFTKKELKVKYKNSALGFLWSFINPLILAVVYTFVFSVVFPTTIKDHPFPLYLIIGLLPWNFFTIAIAMCTGSIIGNANLIKKVAFPKELIPLSIVLSNLVNFLLEMVVILIILVFLGYNFLPYIPIFILTIFLQVIAITGFGFIFAALTVYFRDMEQLITLILLVWFFATPVVYQLGDIASKSNAAATFLKIANPMTSIMLLYRESLLYLTWPSLNLLAYAIGGSFTFLFIGHRIFQKLSPSFAKEV